MNYSYIINHPNHDNKFICNICSENIPSNQIIGLKCNYKKHIFCFTCINDWYLETKINVKSSYNHNYDLIRMCPICRKNGGYLPNLNNKFKKEIHYKGSELKRTCGYKLKNKNEYCMSIGHSKYNDNCRRHFNIINNKINKENKIKQEINDLDKSINNLEIDNKNKKSLVKDIKKNLKENKIKQEK